MRAILLGTVIISLFIFSCGTTEKEDVYTELTDADLMELAAQYTESKQYDKALETYDYVKTKFPDTDFFVEVNVGKARVLGKLERYEEQLDLIYKTLKANIMPQKVPRVYVEIGNFYQKFAPYDPGTSGTGGMEEDYKMAIDFYLKAIQYDESNDMNAKSEAQANIGLVYAKEKNFKMAAKAYQKFLNTYPDSPYFIAVSRRINAPENITPLQIIYPEDVVKEEEAAEEAEEIKEETATEPTKMDPEEKPANQSTPADSVSMQNQSDQNQPEQQEIN